MIQTKVGNLLDVKQGVIVHGCNAQGVMGSGVAAQIKKKWPEAYTVYREHWAGTTRGLGEISYTQVAPGLLVVNAVTQRFFGRDGARYVSYDAVADAFAQIRKTFCGSPVHFPKIGAGLGGGNWDIIAAIIDAELPGVEKTLWVPA